MKKLFIAGSAALLLGLASASAAPIPAPALGNAIDSNTTTVQMMEHGHMRGRMMMRHRMMRHRMMRHRMMHHM